MRKIGAGLTYLQARGNLVVQQIEVTAEESEYRFLKFDMPDFDAR